MSLFKEDKKLLARDEPPFDIEIVKSTDSYLISAKGKEYIDFVMGWCVGNIGWGNPAVTKAIRGYKGPTYVNPSFLYKPWIELAKLLVEITPGKLQKCFRATGGTEAVEIALRAANAYTKKNKFISIENCYHGDSIGASGLESHDYEKHHPGLLSESYKVKPPLNAKAVEQVETFLKCKDVAAIIMEPIICNLGVLIPENIFMERIAELSKKYNALLIIDEVATGFGRTGKLFGAEHYDIEPDIMCMAKAQSGGYCGIGTTIMTADVARSMEYESSYYSTYGWHPLSVAASIANIKFILKNKFKIMENIGAMSAYFEERLNQMSFKNEFEIKIKGLAIAVHFKNNKSYAEKIIEKARKNGLLLSGEENITMFPALTINQKTAKKGLDILEKCL